MNNSVMCIEYLGTLGSAARVPALKGSRRLRDGLFDSPAGGDIETGECRIVDEAIGQQLVEQGNYRAKSFLMVAGALGAVADGKSKFQVLVFAREANGRVKANVDGRPATKDLPEVPARTVAIRLGAPGSARISTASPLEPGLFVATLTAPREPGLVEVHGTVDGEPVVAVIGFYAPTTEPEPVEVQANGEAPPPQG